jgi:hypothetical protein
VSRQESDRIAPGAVVSAAHDVDAPLRDDQTRVARLENLARIGEIGAVAFPHVARQVRDLVCTARFPRAIARDEHGGVLEQLRQRFAVADHECVLEQRLKLLWRTRSRSHRGAS